MSYGGISGKGVGAGGAGGALEHNKREKIKKDRRGDIDYRRAYMNEILYETDNPKQRIKDAIIATEKINKKRIVRRGKHSRKVLVTYVAYASGDNFFKVDNEDWNKLDPGKSSDKEIINRFYKERLKPERLKEWKERVLSFAKEEFGDNLLQATLHMDEKTPHIHIDVIPLKDGKLNKRAMYPTKAGFREMIEGYNQKINEPMHLKQRGPNAGRRGIDFRLYKKLIRAGVKIEKYAEIITKVKKYPLLKTFDSLGINKDDVKPVFGKGKDNFDLLKQYYNTDLVGVIKIVQDMMEKQRENPEYYVENGKER